MMSFGNKGGKLLDRLKIPTHYVLWGLVFEDPW